MAKVTAIRSWKEGGSKERHIQVDFAAENQSFSATIQPSEGHLDLAHRLHSLAALIERSPVLNSPKAVDTL